MYHSFIITLPSFWSIGEERLVQKAPKFQVRSNPRFLALQSDMIGLYTACNEALQGKAHHSCSLACQTSPSWMKACVWEPPKLKQGSAQLSLIDPYGAANVQVNDQCDTLATELS